DPFRMRQTATFCDMVALHRAATKGQRTFFPLRHFAPFCATISLHPAPEPADEHRPHLLTPYFRSRPGRNYTWEIFPATAVRFGTAVALALRFGLRRSEPTRAMDH